jgi:aryl-alcohol dehydrogenase-like predicted oxidoreductase
MLEYRPLGTTDLRVSAIGLGCVTFGREIDAAASFAVLDHAVQRGINLLDTAAVYGDGASEELIGRWLHDRSARDRVVLATKVSGRLTRESILRSVEGSLRRLKVERIDLLQAHDWDTAGSLEEILETFDELVRAGKIRHSGSSNWPADETHRALALAADRGWHRLETVQPRYSLVDRCLEDELLPLCRRQALGVITYSPLGAGFLTGKYHDQQPVPAGTRFDIKPGHQRIYFNEHAFHIVEKLRQLADREGCTMVHLALGWVLARPGLTSVLIGARHPGHVEQAFRAIEAPPNSDILDELDRLSQPPS